MKFTPRKADKTHSHNKQIFFGKTPNILICSALFVTHHTRYTKYHSITNIVNYEKRNKLSISINTHLSSNVPKIE